MTTSNHGEGQDGTKRWDEFVFWARKFHETSDFDNQERDYKLEIGKRLSETRDALLAGNDNWIALLKIAVGPPNNLTQWQDHDTIVKWSQNNPDKASDAFRIIWDPQRPVQARFDEFASAVNAGKRVSIAVSSFLHMAMDLNAFPVYRTTPVETAMKLTGYPLRPESGLMTIGARYEHYLGFLDRVVHESSVRELNLRDRLDAQSVVWTVTKWGAHKEWSADERIAFRQYRGESIPPSPGDGGGFAFPDVSREQILGAMVEFDELERAADDWRSWEDDLRFKWAINEGGKRYPVKHIVSKATRLSTDTFSGGDQANSLVRSRGFHVESLRPGDVQTIDYDPPSFATIVENVAGMGLRISEQTLRRYHLSLETRGFVILAGVSGTGKTWLAEAYARSVGARHLIVPVAPNWTSNEDLLGFFNPFTNHYHHTPFSQFLGEAESAFEAAEAQGQTAQPFHLILDEMNLARVEHYFATFLSGMEVRARNQRATINLGPHEAVALTPNLFVIGTVNVDETTHGFADKVYDRAQLVELEIERTDIETHLNGREYRASLMDVWDAASSVAPFAFRVLDDLAAYVEASLSLGIPWETALDEQLTQKILPKLNGSKPGMEAALIRITEVSAGRFPLTHARAQRMLEGYRQYGFVSYFV